MRILFDLQGVQAEINNQRKVGYYFQLLEAISSKIEKKSIYVLLSQEFSDSIVPIRNDLGKFIPQKNIITFLPAADESDDSEVDLSPVSSVSRQLLIQNLQIDIVYNTAWFDEIESNVVTDFSLYPSSVASVVSLYNVDEVVNKFINNSSYHLKFLKKMADLSRADKVHLCGSVVDYENNSQIIGISNKDIIFNDAYKSIEDEAITVVKEFQDLQDSNLLLDQEIIRNLKHKKPKMAYLSPLPPIKSGISFYSESLIRGLIKYYDIDVVLEQPELLSDFISANCNVLDVEDFEEKHHDYDRIIYHFGNSPYHYHMFDLLSKCGGIVVLHDVYLRDVLNYKDYVEYSKKANIRHDVNVASEIIHSQGYDAVENYFNNNPEYTFPCSNSVITQAKKVIVHSDAARDMAVKYYGNGVDSKFYKIPLLRDLKVLPDRNISRERLNIADDSFVIISLGVVSSQKAHHILLEAINASTLLSNNERFNLIFVGDLPNDEYAETIRTTINNYKLNDRVTITGWVSDEEYLEYIVASDLAIQLRVESKGESSAAVLDCMGYGLPVIINAEGSMSEFPDGVVRKIPAKIMIDDVVSAIEELYTNNKCREDLSHTASELVNDQYSIYSCSKKYAIEIEKTYLNKSMSVSDSIIDMLGTINKKWIKKNIIPITKSLTQSSLDRDKRKRLYVDITAIARLDLRTGIQRVVRAILLELIKNPPGGYKIEPVYITDYGYRWHIKHAYRSTLELLNLPSEWIFDEEIEPVEGDIYLGLDLATSFVVGAKDYLTKLHEKGVGIKFVVYDILPILMPDKFPSSSSITHTEWIKTIACYDGVICISKAVADDVAQWYTDNGIKTLQNFKYDWFHLGADIDASAPTQGLPENASEILNQLSSSISFIMVGTVEPRKGHQQVLAAFEEIWQKGGQEKLVIVGKEGWHMQEFIARIRRHNKLNDKLFYFSSASDEFLQKLYSESTCLIAASEGEGFGLPLIEAAQYGIPILARDIAVFREVAGEHATYFKAMDEKELANSIGLWLSEFRQNKHIASKNMPWISWKDSAEALKSIIG